MSIFGLTKKQFLKRSKECLDIQGIHVLNINQLINLESEERISKTESYRRIKSVMEDLNKVFNKYQKLKPPSDCLKFKQRILNSILLLQEAASAIYDSNPQELMDEDKFDHNKIKESQMYLNSFREVFGPLTKEIDNYMRSK